MSQSTHQSQHSQTDTAHPSHSQLSSWASSSSDFWATVAAGQGDFIESLRAQIRKKQGKEDVTDVHLMLSLAANSDSLNEACRTGQLSKANFEQIRQFVIDKRGNTNWVDDELNRTEAVLNACKAQNRIDKLLFYLRFAKPERYPEADMLFPVIHHLSKLPIPNWPGGKDVISQLQGETNRENPNPTRNWLIHVNHAVLLTGKGAPWNRCEAFLTLRQDCREMCLAAGRGWLSEQHKQRLHQIVTGGRELEADLKAWEEQRKLLVDKATREPGKIPTGILESGPPSFMAISEAYHFVSVLHQTFAPQPERVFDGPQRILQDLRRELHRDLTDALTRTDFIKLSSDNK